MQDNLLTQLVDLLKHEVTQFDKDKYLKNQDKKFQILKPKTLTLTKRFETPSFFPAPPAIQQSQCNKFLHVLNYQSRELHMRYLEQCFIIDQLQIQREFYPKVIPRILTYSLPEDPTYYVRQLSLRPLPKNQISYECFIQQSVQLQKTLVQHINQNVQNNIAISNRVTQLKLLLGDNYKPSLIKSTENARRNKQSDNIIGLNLHLDSLSQGQIFDLLFTQFQEQNNNQQNITEQDVKETPSFEDILYQKIHRSQKLDVKYPTLMKPGVLKPYQMDCLKFLFSMYNCQALNREPSSGKTVPGVCVADDMGLGKTIQTIAFLSYLHEKKLSKNMHLIISPLAVSDGWLNEFKTWCSNFNVLVYKGNDRAKLRHEIVSRKGYYQAIITTYDYAMYDRNFFKKLVFDVVVVDEASRIKNCQSKLIGVLRNDITCKFRLLLSGTPLQNNLKELFTLLQFIHGSVFHQFEQFDLVFGKIFKKTQQTKSVENAKDETTVQEETSQISVDQEMSELKESDLDTEIRDLNADPSRPDTAFSNATGVGTSIVNSTFTNGKNDDILFTDTEKIFIISRLHGIIKPFMIRRIKTDVLDQLPPKQEVILRCPLSGLQKHLYYIAVLEAGRLLENKEVVQEFDAKTLPKHFIRNVDMYLRRVCNHPYLGLEIEQLKMLYYYLVNKSEKFMNEHLQHNTKLAQKQIELEEKNPVVINENIQQSQLHFIQNTYIQEQLWRYSGKLDILNRMLVKFKAGNHRVLIFSQFKHVLDILQDYMYSKEFAFLRFDGDVKDELRIKMVRDFNAVDSKYFVFLLSTRAAAHGLNLQTADTVVIYDCDFNAFYDLQAQDRVYRIGQTKAVKVFKLYTNTKLEQKMLNIAQNKLQLAQTIIEAGGLGGETQSARKTGREILLEILQSGQFLENEGEILSNADLNKAIARNEGELRLFEQMENQQESYWEERNLGQKLERVDTEIPEIFLKNNEMSATLVKKYLIDENTDFISELEESISAPAQPAVKRGRGRPRKAERPIYDYNPEDEVPAQPQNVQSQQSQQPSQSQTAERRVETKQDVVIPEMNPFRKTPGEIEAVKDIAQSEEPSSASVGSAVVDVSALDVSSYINKPVFFTFAQALKNITFLTNPHEFVRDIQISKTVVERVKQPDAMLKYLADDIIMRLLENHKFTGVNFIQVMSGIPLLPSDLQSITDYLSDEYSTQYQMYQDVKLEDARLQSFKDISNYSKFVIEINGTKIGVLFNPQLLQQLAQKHPDMLSNGQPSKQLIQFHVRLLFVLHAMLVFTDPESDYFEESFEIKTGFRLPFHALLPFWVLPGREQLPEYYQQIKSPISAKLIWFKAITLQYQSLAEFVRDWKQAFRNALFFNPRGSPLEKLSRDLQSYLRNNLECIFDMDDVAEVFDYFYDYDRRTKIERRFYQIQSDHIGFGLVDALEIADEITKYSGIKPAQGECDLQFGAGCYGGDYYEHLALYMTELRAKLDHKKALK